ncbi:hypothetical protein [Anaerovorax odorimutans]|uniref:hypothetical protein n=1 Tax=Anaerovorax odorimutans TaxID=109327 RepID=UPI0003F5F47D|nr:hypothetical protein [Anaerovorax odorimutans]
MGEFRRDLYKREHDRQLAIEQLQKMQEMPWFKLLKEDVERGEVFPALRYSGEIDFYYRGALLCKYKGNLKGEPTTSRNNGPFNPENPDDYKKTKESCEEWGKKASGKANERATLSVLYGKFSPYIKPTLSMILLDIEIGFPTLCEENYKNTQVDLLFLDKNTGMLYFVEAKDAGDSRIKSMDTGNSLYELFDREEVSKQLKKYDMNLETRKNEILDAYKESLRIMSEIFGCEIYSGKLSLYKRTKLLVYGKSTENGIQSLKAIRAKLDNDLIVFENGLDMVDDLPEKITAGSFCEEP